MKKLGDFKTGNSVNESNGINTYITYNEFRSVVKQNLYDEFEVAQKFTLAMISKDSLDIFTNNRTFKIRSNTTFLEFEAKHINSFELDPNNNIRFSVGGVYFSLYKK